MDPAPTSLLPTLRALWTRLTSAAGALCRPALWILVAAGAVSLPLFASGGSREPFGRPWYFGRLLFVVLLMAAALARPGASGSDDSARRRRCFAVLVFLASYASFVSNYRTLSSGDNLPTRALPAALLAGDGFDLSRVVPDSLHGHYSLVKSDGALQSAFPLGTGLLATPYHALVRSVFPRTADAEGLMSARVEKHLAALLTALGVLFVFLGASDLAKTDWGRALWALALATGTPLLSSASQGLWSLTGEFFLIALAAWLVSRSRHAPLGELAGGAAAGAAFLCRPTALVLVPVLLCISRRKLRAVAPFAAGLATSVAAACALNYRLSGHPLGAYLQLNSRPRLWDAEGFLERLAGVLVSPSRGLVWFFPALVVGFVIVALRWRRLSRTRQCTALAGFAATVAIILMTASYRNWWGGYSVGPRLLAELALPSILVCAIAFSVAGRGARTLLVVLLLAQSVVHLRIASFKRALDWNGVVDVDRGGQELFSLRNSQLAAAFVPGWQYRPARSGYFLAARAPRSPEPWRPVDLSAVANADYSRWAVEDSPLARWHLYLPRLRPGEEPARGRSEFDFLPPGALNMLRLCAGESAEVPLDGELGLRRLAAVLAWRGSETPSGPVGEFRLIRSDGFEEVRPLRLGRDVFDPATALAPPGHAILAGHWRDFDELVRTGFQFRRRASYSTLRIGGPAPGETGCLYVLAVSVF